MRKTTQCYICRKNGKNIEYLMLYRNRKPEDPNEGKWLGIGGKVEAGETPLEANVREVREETGISLNPEDCRFHGNIKFINTIYEDEEIYLYSVEVPEDTQPIDCDEGELHWIDASKIMTLNMWEGDRQFLAPLLEGGTDINMTLYYDGDELVRTEKNGD